MKAPAVHQTCKETNAREKTWVSGRRSKANAQDKYEPQPFTGRDPGEALFKEGTRNWPERTSPQELDTDAKSESGAFRVPSFSSTFYGLEVETEQGDWTKKIKRATAAFGNGKWGVCVFGF